MDDLEILEKILNSIGSITPDALLKELDRPQWDRVNRCHDWRNYVPEVIRETWDDLPTLARLIAYIYASKTAQEETWE